MKLLLSLILVFACSVIGFGQTKQDVKKPITKEKPNNPEQLTKPATKELPAKETPVAGVIGHLRPGETREVASLRKLEGAYVVIAAIDNNAKYLFTETQLQFEIEARLKSNGVRVLTEKEWLESIGSPYLYLKLDLLRDEKTGIFTYTFNLSLNQDAQLVRDKGFKTLVPTWNKIGLGQTAAQTASSVIRTYIGKTVDKFCLDFLKANQVK